MVRIKVTINYGFVQLRSVSLVVQLGLDVLLLLLSSQNVLVTVT